MDNLEYDHPLLLSYLTTLAQMAVLAPSIFETRQKAIIKDFVVKELLVKDRVRLMLVVVEVVLTVIMIVMVIVIVIILIIIIVIV